MDEYLGNSIYIKLTFSYSEVKNRLNAFAKKLKFHIPSLIFPHIFITRKFHKYPIKFRFVACASNNYSLHADNFFSIY